MAQAELDDFDRHILKIVQRDCSLSHELIGEQVGLSGSSVRRRLARMRDDGLIRGEVALLNRDEFAITLIVRVSFARETPEEYQAFDRQMQALPEVSQCYRISGEDDYLLIVNAPSLKGYEEWAMREIMSNEAVRRYSTCVVWSCQKFETAVPV